MAKLRAAIALLFLVFAGTPSLAQTYPDRPIHLIVPFAAGGLVDVLARMLGEELSKAFAQPIIIENRPQHRRRPTGQGEVAQEPSRQNRQTIPSIAAEYCAAIGFGESRSRFR